MPVSREDRGTESSPWIDDHRACTGLRPRPPARGEGVFAPLHLAQVAHHGLGEGFLSTSAEIHQRGFPVTGTLLELPEQLLAIGEESLVRQEMLEVEVLGRVVERLPNALHRDLDLAEPSERERLGIRGPSSPRVVRGTRARRAASGSA